jgi:pimeloyl-ACP methyl ester carboxylesterase
MALKRKGVSMGLLRLGWMGVLLVLQACAPHRAVQGPIPLVSDQQACGVQAGNLIVMLPGLRDFPADFVAEGFVAAVRQRQLDADITLLDAHVGYYNERQIVSRLHDEVIAPARARGYERIWLVGISLGGLGSLLYSQAHPQDITGFYAMAPYLGEKSTVKDVTTQGLAQWQPAEPEPMGTPAWRLAQAYLSGGAGLPRGHIGYGADDRFAQANALWATALPPGHRYVVEGGHDWRTWKALWERFLDTGVVGQTQRIHQPCAIVLLP